MLMQLRGHSSDNYLTWRFITWNSSDRHEILTIYGIKYATWVDTQTLSYAVNSIMVFAYHHCLWWLLDRRQDQDCMSLAINCWLITIAKCRSLSKEGRYGWCPFSNTLGSNGGVSTLYWILSSTAILRNVHFIVHVYMYKLVSSCFVNIGAILMQYYVFNLMKTNLSLAPKIQLSR